MPLSSSNAVRQLSDGNSIGTILGTGATDLIGFYGLTAGVARSVMATTAATITLQTIGAGSTGGVGFTSLTMFGNYVSTIANMQADLASLRTQLAALGLVA